MTRLRLALLCFCLALVWTDTAWSAALTAAVPAEPVSLDPHRAAGQSSWPYIYSCYQRLTEFKPGIADVQPSLALTWRVSDDGRLYTFVLREGEVFSDGRPVDAEAVRWSFSRVFQLAEVASLYFPYLTGIEILGPHTIRFTLNRPYPLFPAALAACPGSIVSPGLRDHPPGYLDRHTLGSGSYFIREWEPGRPMIVQSRKDKVEESNISLFKGILEVNSNHMLKLIEEDQIQMALQIAAPPASPQTAPPNVVLHTLPDRALTFLTLNCRKPWLERPEARQALAHAIDGERILRVLPRPATPPTGVLLEGVWGRDTDSALPAYNPEAAKALLSAVPRPSQPLTLLFESVPTNDPVVRCIQEDLKAVGIGIKLSRTEKAEFDRLLTTGDFDLALQTWRPPTPAPETILEHWFRSERPGFPGNGSFYRNPDMDRWLDQAANTTDKNRLMELYRDIQRTGIEDSPYIFLYQSGLQIGLSPRVHGFTFHPARGMVYALSELSLRAPAPPAASPKGFKHPH